MNCKRLGWVTGIVATAGILALAGCSADQAYRSVRNRFPEGDVTTVPGYEYAFIIRTPSNEVWYVYYDGQKGDEAKHVRPVLLFGARDGGKQPAANAAGAAVATTNGTPAVP